MDKQKKKLLDEQTWTLKHQKARQKIATSFHKLKVCWKILYSALKPVISFFGGLLLYYVGGSGVLKVVGKLKFSFVNSRVVGYGTPKYLLCP